jgi:hypothetical protein
MEFSAPLADTECEPCKYSAKNIIENLQKSFVFLPCFEEIAMCPCTAEERLTTRVKV